MLQPLREFFPSSNAYTYVEPFCGSAALFFDRRPPRAILADINADLINFYKSTRRKPADVFEIASKLKRSKTTYLRIRCQISAEKDDLTRAAYFYYLNRNCFNGLYRTNRAGIFNVPFSQSRTGRMLSWEDFSDAATALETATICARDFESLVRDNLQPSSFFFLDPPYAVRGRSPFVDYNGQAFDSSDVTRLLSCLRAIDDSGGRFVLTYDSALAHTFLLRKRWRQHEIVVRRNISGFSSARKNATEVLTTNIAQ
jgi:DNA adenine methylase